MCEAAVPFRSTDQHESPSNASWRRDPPEAAGRTCRKTARRRTERNYVFGVLLPILFSPAVVSRFSRSLMCSRGGTMRVADRRRRAGDASETQTVGSATFGR